MQKKVNARIRLERIRAHHWRYARIKARTHGACFYCEAPATEHDHVPALSYADCLDLKRYTALRPMVLVPSCGWCNSRLSDKPLFSMAERAAHLERKLVEAYEKRFALWSDEELGVMSPMFQSMIKARRAELWRMRDRIRALQTCIIHGDEWVLDQTEL